MMVKSSDVIRRIDVIHLLLAVKDYVDNDSPKWCRIPQRDIVNFLLEKIYQIDCAEELIDD